MLQRLMAAEQGQCVVYLTSLGVIRNTIQRCSNVRKIFRNMFVRIVEKDLYIRGDYKAELETRLETNLSSLKLPLIFLNGNLIGDESVLERLNETGELKDMVRTLRDKEGVQRVCQVCGDTRVTPCPGCRGSKVGTNMWHGRVKLKCTICDMAGLVSCDMC